MYLSAIDKPRTTVFPKNSVFLQQESKTTVPDLDNWQHLPSQDASSVTLKKVEEWSLTFKNGGKAVHSLQGDFVESPEHATVAVDALEFTPEINCEGYNCDRPARLIIEKNGMKQRIESDGTLYLEPPGTTQGFGYTMDPDGHGYVGGSFPPFDVKISDDHQRILFLVEEHGEAQEPVCVSLIAGTSWMCK